MYCAGCEGLIIAIAIILVLYCAGCEGLLLKGVNALLVDDSFSLPSEYNKLACSTAEQVLKLIETDTDRASILEKELASMLYTCLKHKRKKQKAYREVMWSDYHSLRTSERYICLWNKIVQQADVTFVQYVGHFIFKELIKREHQKTDVFVVHKPPAMTYEEINALRYVSGYIPRMLRKRLKTSTLPHKLREDLKLCLYDLLDDGDEVYDESQDWVTQVNRGGLTLVNTATFEVFLAVEKELREKLFMQEGVPEFSDNMRQDIGDSDDVQFHWSLVSSDWEEESAKVLLEMVICQYVKIRGFSYSSALLEELKKTNKKTIQKSKGIRKQLLPADKEDS